VKEKVVLAWSGGKDSAMALHALLASNRYEVVSLLTTVAKQYERISHHGVREELLEAQKQGEGKNLRFRVEDIEVELQVTTTQEAGVEGGVKFWVYNAKAEGKLAKQSVQKVKFKLKPETAEGDPLRVADQDKKPQD